MNHFLSITLPLAEFFLYCDIKDQSSWSPWTWPQTVSVAQDGWRGKLDNPLHADLKLLTWPWVPCELKRCHTAARKDTAHLLCIPRRVVFRSSEVRIPLRTGLARLHQGSGSLMGRWERGSGWGIHVNPWLIHVSVWHNPLQYCKVINLQLIKIKEKKKSSGV